MYTSKQRYNNAVWKSFKGEFKITDFAEQNNKITSSLNQGVYSEMYTGETVVFRHEKMDSTLLLMHRSWAVHLRRP